MMNAGNSECMRQPPSSDQNVARERFVYQRCKGRVGRQEDIPPEADAAGHRARRYRALDASKYATPTSSFAGGKHGTLIFAAVSDGGGDGLLRAHHDAVIQPLLKREDGPAAQTPSSSTGK